MRGAGALIVVPSGSKGGAEGVAFTLARELARSGVHVWLYAMVGGLQPELVELSQRQNITVIAARSGRERYGVAAAIARISALSYRNRLSLVYSTHVHVNAMLGLMRRLKLLRCDRLVARESTVIFDRFSGWLRNLFALMYRVGYGPQDLLIAQTSEMKLKLVEFLGANPVENFEVVANPVDCGRIQRLASEVPVGGLPVRRRAVACGRLVAIKGFGNLIDAFAIVADEVPDIDLHIIGGGPLLDELRLRVPSTLLDRVRFHGQMNNPFPLIRGAAIGVISSLKEGFPNVLVEMMAVGVEQIVTTPCAAAVEEIPSVVLANGFKSDQLASAFLKALAMDKSNSAEFQRYVSMVHSVRAFCAKVAPDVTFQSEDGE